VPAALLEMNIQDTNIYKEDEEKYIVFIYFQYVGGEHGKCKNVTPVIETQQYPSHIMEQLGLDSSISGDL